MKTIDEFVGGLNIEQLQAIAKNVCTEETNKLIGELKLINFWTKEENPDKMRHIQRSIELYNIRKLRLEEKGLFNSTFDDYLEEAKKGKLDESRVEYLKYQEVKY